MHPFDTLDPLFDAVGIVASSESGADDDGDRADTADRAADVGEGGWRDCRRRRWVLAAVDGVGAQAQVRGIDTAAKSYPLRV